MIHAAVKSRDNSTDITGTSGFVVTDDDLLFISMTENVRYFFMTFRFFIIKRSLMDDKSF